MNDLKMLSELNKLCEHRAIFALWSNGIDSESMVDKVLSERFRLIYSGLHAWDKALVDRNFQRFDGIEPKRHSTKADVVGRGSFKIYIVEDSAASFGYLQDTSKRLKRVNKNFIQAKADIRQYTAGLYDIHCSDSVEELCTNGLALFGYPAFRQLLLEQGDVDIPLELTMPGSTSWDSQEELLRHLSMSLEYVLLNPEVLSVTDESNRTLRILTNDVDNLIAVSGARRQIATDNLLRLQISGEPVQIEAIQLKDNYFDAFWQNTLLANRVYSDSAGFIPDAENSFFYSLYSMLIKQPSGGEIAIQSLKKQSTAIGLELDEYLANNAEGLLGLLQAYMTTHRYQFTLYDNSRAYLNLSNFSKAVGNSKSLVRIKLYLLRLSKLPTKLLVSSRQLLEKYPALQTLIKNIKRRLF